MLSKLHAKLRLHRYAFSIAAIACLTVVAFIVLLHPFNNGSENNRGIYPTGGTYTVTKADGITCTKSLPPQCKGELELSPGGMERLGASIDRDTTVRYATKEIQIYPNAIKEGQVAQITFQPDSAVIDVMVIAESGESIID